jgi:predicted dehydrogenase
MRMNLDQRSSGGNWATHKNLLRSTSPIVDCGVHYVDVMCRMTGSRPVSVNGIGARLSDEIAPGQVNYRPSAGDVRRRLHRLVRGRVGSDDERDGVLREGCDRAEGRREHRRRKRGRGGPLRRC